MTDVKPVPSGDLWGEFVGLLPLAVRTTLRQTLTNAAALSAAVHAGWALPDLVDYVTAPAAQATNPAAVVALRLRQAAAKRPTTRRLNIVPGAGDCVVCGQPSHGVRTLGGAPRCVGCLGA